MNLNDIVGSSWKSVRNFVNGVVLCSLLSTGIAYADNTKVPEGGAKWGQQDKKEQTCPPNCEKPAQQKTSQSKKPIKKQTKKGIHCKESPLPGRNVNFTLGDKKVNGLDFLCWDKKTALRQGYNLKDKIRGTTYTKDPCQRCRGNEYAYRTHAAYCRDRAKLKTAQSGKSEDKVFYTGTWNSKDKSCNFTGSCAHLSGVYKLVKKGRKESCEAVIAPAKCGKDHLNLCTTKNDCETATGHFYDNKCNVQPKPIETQQHKKTPPIVKTLEIQPFISAKTGETGFYGSFGVDHSAVKVKGTGGALTSIYFNQFVLKAIKEFHLNLSQGWALSPQARLEYNAINGSQKMEGHNFWLGAGLGINQTTVNTTKNTNNQFEFVCYVQTLASQASRTIISLLDNLGTIHSTLNYTDAWRAGGELRLLVDSKLALELFGEYGRQGQNQFTTLNGAPLSEGAATRNTLQHSNLELAIQYRADELLNPTANFSWRQDKYTLEDGSSKAYDNFTLSLGNEFNLNDGKLRLKPTLIRPTQTGQFGFGLEACIGKNRELCFDVSYTPAPSEATDRTNQILPIIKGNIQGSF